MAHVLLLIPSRTYRTHDFMEAAGRLGIEVVVGSEHRPALGRLMEGRHLRLDFNDVPGAVRRITGFAAHRAIDAIVAVDDTGLAVAASASEALSLPHNTPESVASTRDKATMRERFQAAGLLTPRFTKVDIADDPAAIATRLAYPAVVKPVGLSASQGVIKVERPTDFAAVFTRVASIVRSCRPKAGAESLLVEDFIPGKEIAIEGLLRRGDLEVLAVFDKPDPLDGPFFEETIYVTPSRLARDVQRNIRETVARAVLALGLTEGPIHAELRLNDEGLWMLEIAARSIGGLCSRTLRFGSGISLEELILRHAARMPMPEHGREQEAAGVMMLPIPGAGRLRQVDGQAQATRVPGISGLVITIPPGETLVPLPEGDRYLGFMFARGARPEAVEHSLREAHAQLRVLIDA